MMKLLAAGIAALALAAPAGAAAVFLHVNPTTVGPGGYVKVTGAGCRAGETVYLISPAFAGHAFVQGSVATRARANGSFSRFAAIRKHVAARRYAVTARCGGGNLGVAAHFRVR